MAVADILISKALELLISPIANEIEQKIKLVVGVKDEVKMLTNNLQSIQAVLNDAEKRERNEETIRLWLHRLKDISYDIDDVLDEWSTEIFKSQNEGPKRNKVWSSIISFCFCYREVYFHHDIAVRIMELSQSLDVIAKEKERYNFLLIKGSEKVERVMTTSVLNIPEIRHREQDENAVINLLLAESEQNPHVISLVGMGGIGKTTLAKLVYIAKIVETLFEIRVWVCVSDPFDEIRIAKAILESLKGSTPNLVEMQNIVVEIQQYIKGKKFLLVLDDVWNEEAKKWEQVENFLKCGLPGSKILVTTRNENVARIMGCIDIIRLGMLSNEDCWSIFSQVVFSKRASVDHNESLEIIGRKIVARCKGLPLAVKTIGGLLRFKNSVEEWQSVLDSELWELEEVEREVLAPLWLSYYDLSSSLKQCFLYCVIFPKDHRMSKRKLIEMWMGQGYLKATKNKDMEMVGDEQFENLAMRFFFQDFEEDERDNSNIYCNMHDIVHDFGQSLIKNECCRIEVNNPSERNIEFNSNEMRHVGIMLGKGVLYPSSVWVMIRKEVSFPSSVYALKRLRSLFVLYSGFSMIEVALSNIFNELTCLRSLSLSRCSITEIPSNISKLIHLRQLDLSYNEELTKLPETVCKLYNLQTLDVDWCASLERLPRGMGKLVNLRCLYNFGCELCLLPKGIGRLSGLRRLSELRMGNEEEELMSLRDLEKLNLLSGYLRIEWIRQHVADVDVKDAKQAQLKDKRHLIDLVLSFSDERGAEWRKGGDEMLLEALEPSPYLKSLEIYFYQGIKMCNPNWIMSLTFLRKLVLKHWKYIKELPPLGKLPSLESLKLFRFESIKKVGVEFLGIDHETTTSTTTLFPKLVNLEFNEMDDWEEWNYEKDNNGEIKIMPSLRFLTLRRCPKLEAKPNYILQNSSLQIKMENCETLQGLRREPVKVTSLPHPRSPWLHSPMPLPGRHSPEPLRRRHSHELLRRRHSPEPLRRRQSTEPLPRHHSPELLPGHHSPMPLPMHHAPVPLPRHQSRQSSKLFLRRQSSFRALIKAIF